MNKDIDNLLKLLKMTLAMKESAYNAHMLKHKGVKLNPEAVAELCDNHIKLIEDCIKNLKKE